MSALFFSRADYADIRNRTASKALEWVWQASPSLGAAGATWAQIMNSGLHLYFPLPGMCFDTVNCNDELFQDDPRLKDFNVPDMVGRAVSLAKGQALNYVGGDQMWTMGFDFNYEHAAEWFDNLDKLIHYVNVNTSIHGVRMFYSTPSLYYDAKAAYPYTWPTSVNSDLMPYLDGPHSSWAGYFTSRAALKGYVRSTSWLAQAARPLLSFASPGSGTDAGYAMSQLDEELGVAQHHDAVAGTSMRHVARDYAARLSSGRAALAPGLAAAVAALTRADAVLAPGTRFATCDLANASICPALESASSPVLLAVLNAQSKPLDVAAAGLLRVPVGMPAGVASWGVMDAVTGVTVVAQLLPASDADLWLHDTYYGAPAAPANTSFWLTFPAPAPASGIGLYRIAPVASVGEAPNTSASVVTRIAPGTASSINSANGVTLNFDTSGNLASISTPQIGSVPLTQSWAWWNASSGDAISSQASGAYLFRPVTNSSAIPLGSPASLILVTGPLVSEARQTWGGETRGAGGAWVTQATRVWVGSTAVDIEWTAGPIPAAESGDSYYIGKELVARYALPGRSSNASWTTDSNGRDMVSRKRDYRSTWTYQATEPIAGNYAPVNAAIEVRSADISLAVVVDRTQGGASLVDGSLELMVHRRLAFDDNRGVGEPLNETFVTPSTGVEHGLVVRGVHRLLVEPVAIAAQGRRSVMNAVSLFAPQTLIAPLPSLAPAPGTLRAYSGLRSATGLPLNVQLLTAQALGRLDATSTAILVRLSHSFAVGEDPLYSVPVNVSLATLFADFNITSATETTLSANSPLARIARREMSVAPAADGAHGAGKSATLQMGFAPSLVDADPALTATLNPLEIRTFACVTDFAAPAAGTDASNEVVAPRWVRFLVGDIAAGDGAPLPVA